MSIGDKIRQIVHDDWDYTDAAPRARLISRRPPNIARNFGVKVNRRGVRPAPLFRYHNVLEMGATYLR
jgi:hypothetical protein